MDTSTAVVLQGVKFFLTTIFIATVMSGCEGDRGAPGEPGVTTTNIVITSDLPPTSLAITIDSVTINSAPVVELSAKDENGLPFTGINSGDLSFAIAKLIPGSLGDPSKWQSYLNIEETATVGPGTGNTAVQSTRESDGTLVNHGDGSYTYTFATDITNVTTPLAVPYDATLTHRVAIQVGGGLPVSNPIYTFRPSDGATSGIFTRDIVKIENCNECHNKLALHGGGRVDTQYCVICHNPGSTDANSGNTVDFKVMIHKIHRGENLPTIPGPDGIIEDDPATAGVDESADNGEYSIYGYLDNKHDYSDVALPQDIRHCTKCHDGSGNKNTNPRFTPDGNNWQTQISMAACGSCHDNIKFDVPGPPIPGATDPDGHPGGVMVDNSLCTTCHVATGPVGSIAETHFLAEPLARRNYKLNILEICGEPVDTDPGPICAPGVNPTVTFSVTDPLNGDAKYDITAPEFGSGSTLSFLVAWDTRDYHNTDGTGTRPGRADSISISGAAAAAVPLTYTVTASFIIPNAGTGGATNYTATGSGTVGAQGRLAGDFDGDGIYNESGANNSLTDEQERIFVKSEVKHFRIDDPKVVARRPTVQNAKCNKCHDQVSFHGGSRSGEYGVCILCHNPNNTDIAARNDPGAVLPALDGKAEEAIDFKRMIHGIHAGAQTHYDGSEGHGFREKGLVLFGYGGGEHDYSHTRFPGILNDCETCHEPGAYFLDDEWASPTANDILSTTINTDPLGTDTTWVNPDDDLNISPTAAVCSACHDSDVAKAHMIVPGGAVFGDLGDTQIAITNGVVETCSVCHGPGRDADVEKVHAVR